MEQTPKILPVNNHSHDEFPVKIRNKLLIVLIGIFSAGLITLSSLTYYKSSELFDQVIEEKSIDEVQIAVSKISNWIEERKKVIDVLHYISSKDYDLTNKSSDYFKEIASAFNVKSIYIAQSINNKLIFNDDSSTSYKLDPVKYQWFINAINNEGTVISKPYYDNFEENEHNITIASKINNNDLNNKVIAMDVSMETLRVIVRDIEFGKLSRSYLLTKSGEIIHKKIKSTGDTSSDEIKLPKLNEFLNSKEKIMAFFSDEEYRVYADIPNTDLLISFIIPKSEINSHLVELKKIFLIVSLITILILFITILWISNYITRPILQLEKAAKKLNDGNYEDKLRVKTKDEIGLLTYRFNLMAEGLKEKEKIRSAFGRYVTPDAVSEILDGKSNLGGEKRLITVLISDIRGFTSFSEKTDPEKLVSVLNEYFTRMDNIICEFGGSINRYLGDGILALFGAPRLIENSAYASVQAAIKMQEELINFNKDMNTDFRVGIGVHTGVAIVGNMGSINHTEYTVIGDTANLASRIESLTKNYGENILISGTTFSLLPQNTFDNKIIDKVKVRGRDEPVYLYTPNRKDTVDEALLMDTNNIIQTYINGNFELALDKIKNLSENNLTPHLKTILKQCEHNIQNNIKYWDNMYS